MPVNSPVFKGVSTLIWGTQSRLGTPSGAIVESIDITPKNPTGLGEIENGDGAGVADVLLDDGFDAKVTVVNDPAKTYPATGQAVTLVLAQRSGGGSPNYTGSASFTCYITGDPDDKYARKKEGSRTLNLRYRPGITP